ncbi:hypothetical protein OH77DRAFT_93963 [Trametes cingulata]|nr:hypothetical protein OH77DRAFT_93963 [Trametes cingulata]
MLYAQRGVSVELPQTTSPVFVQAVSPRISTPMTPPSSPPISPSKAYVASTRDVLNSSVRVGAPWMLSGGKLSAPRDRETRFAGVRSLATDFVPVWALYRAVVRVSVAKTGWVCGS